MLSDAYRAVGNSLLNRNSIDDLCATGEVLRDWFSRTDFVAVDPLKNHTHGISASTRSTGSNFIELLTALAGMDALYFQGSVADERKGRKVTREWYWAKDLNMVRRPDAVKKKIEVCAMVDVDEHVDMPNLLACHFQPYLLYTFVPSVAAKSGGGDYAYRFHENGEVEYVVAGGGCYRHKVWDYGHDSIMVSGWEIVCVGLPVWVRYTAFYKVERRNVDDDHQVVLLSPLRRWSEILPGGFATLAANLIQAPVLERLDPVKDGFVRIERMTARGMEVSVAKVGDFSCATVPVCVNEEIRIKSELSKALSVSMAKSSMANHGLEITHGAEVLTAYHRVASSVVTTRSFDTSIGVRSYQFLPKLANHEPDAKPSMYSFMNPIIPGFAPAMCAGNDKRGVEKRVKGVRTTSKVTPFLQTRIKMFVNFIAGHILVPEDEDEVYRRQARPTQRAILERANYETHSGVGMNFMKRQAETNVSDPRIITTIDGADKKDYSAYMYALSDYLKHLPWYASGLKPVQVAERVASVCVNSEQLPYANKQLLETDFSRMDGRISEVPRYLEQVVIQQLFHPSLHALLLGLMAKQTWLTCSTKFGEHYNSGLARASGSPETSVFNTLLTGFDMFLSYYLMCGDDGLAWDALATRSVCLGDDGVAGGMRKDEAERAASMIGQKLTVKVRVPGQTVSFLARHYGPDVWYGDADSCCDFPRQLSKFHLATHVRNDADSRLLKLREKAFAYFLTDEHTPVLGTFVKRVLTLAPVQHGKGRGHEYTNALGIWNSQYPKDDQYPSREAGRGWKLELLESQLPDFVPSLFEDWVASCSTTDELMAPPPPVEIEAKHPGGQEAVDVDGNILLPPATSPVVTPTKRGNRGGKRANRVKTPSASKSATPQRVTPRKMRKPRVDKA